MKLTIGIINIITSIMYFVTFLLSQNLIYGLLSLTHLIAACIFINVYFYEFRKM